MLCRKLYGETQDTAMGKLFEDAAYGSEDDWWNYYKSINYGEVEKCLKTG